MLRAWRRNLIAQVESTGSHGGYSHGGGSDRDVIDRDVARSATQAPMLRDIDELVHGKRFALKTYIFRKHKWTPAEAVLWLSLSAFANLPAKLCFPMVASRKRSSNSLKAMQYSRKRNNRHVARCSEARVQPYFRAL